MRKSTMKIIAVAVIMSLLLSFASFNTAFADEAPTVSYEFTGRHKESKGYAEGTITIDAGNCNDNTYFFVYFGDENGILPGYKEISSFKLPDNDKYSVILPQNMLLPEGATRILVFAGNDLSSVDTSLNNVICETSLPEAKRFQDSPAELKFASLSDLHLNYDWADEKWLRVLNYMESIGIDLITMSGDYTNDGSRGQFEKFAKQIKNSDYTGRIWGCIGNHDTGNPDNYLKYFADLCVDGENLYFYKIAENGDVFIFLAQDTLSETGNSHKEDCFSAEQLDWLEELLRKYSNMGVNIFIYEHANFYNWGAGDIIPGVYVQPMHISPDFPNNTRLAALLNEYKEAIFITGHTHVAFSELKNFVDNNGTTARTVHNSSVSQIRTFNGDGTALIYNTNDHESEGYIVTVYPDEIVYRGMDFSTHLFIPTACYIMNSFSADHSNTADIKSVTVNENKSTLLYFAGDPSDKIKITLDVTYNDGTVKEVSDGINVLLMNNETTILPDQSVISVDTDYFMIFYGGIWTEFKPVIAEENYLERLSGNGTKEEPYLIASPVDFYYFTMATEAVISKSDDGLKVLTGNYYFKQTADIDMTLLEKQFKYFGSNSSSVNKYIFDGVYNGNGHTLNVDFTGKSGAVTVFPYINGLILNLNITGSISSKYDTGNISVFNGITKNGALINVITDISFHIGKGYGVANECYGTLIDCLFAGSADGKSLILTEGKYSPTQSSSIYHCFVNAEGVAFEDITIPYIDNTGTAKTEFDRRNNNEKNLISSVFEKYGLSLDDLIFWTDYNGEDAGSPLLIIASVVAAVIIIIAILIIIKKKRKNG